MTKAELEREVSVLKEKLEEVLNGVEKPVEEGPVTPEQAKMVLSRFVDIFKGRDESKTAKKGGSIWLLDKPLWDLAFGIDRGWELTDRQIGWAAQIMNGAYCKHPEKIKQHREHYSNLVNELKAA